MLLSIPVFVLGESLRYVFAIQNDPTHTAGEGAATFAVRYRSLETPDLFQHGAEVVVEGRVPAHPSGAIFVADNVLAKCPSKFQAMADDEAEAEQKSL